MYKPVIIIVLYKTPRTEIERLIIEAKILNFPLIFIDNSHNNQGYAFGINQGIKKALRNAHNPFLIANPDISFKSLSKGQILSVLDHFDIGGFSMKQHENIYYGGKLDKWRMSGGLIKLKPKERFVSCDFVSGSLMVINRKVIDTVGLFDESYGMYYEEVDYSIRAQKAGFTVGIDSQLVYDHFENSVNNKEKKDYLARNRWKILWRYGSWQQKLYEIIRLPKTITERLK